MFNIGEFYSLQYKGYASNNIYIVEVKKVTKQKVHLLFHSMNGEPYSTSGYEHIEEHNLINFRPRGDSVARKLTKLELALK